MLVCQLTLVVDFCRVVLALTLFVGQFYYSVGSLTKQAAEAVVRMDPRRGSVSRRRRAR